MIRRPCGFLTVPALVLAASGLAHAAPQPSAALAVHAASQVVFEPNRGQVAMAAPFIARASDYTACIAHGAITLALKPLAAAAQEDSDGASNGADSSSALVRLRLVGAKSAVPLIAADRQRGTVSYLIGHNAHGWRTGIPTYGTVSEHQVYPGIDTLYSGANGHVEWDFRVAPHADPSAIALSVEGAAPSLDRKSGTLTLSTHSGGIALPRPQVYQIADGGRRAPVAASYTIAPDHRTVRIALAPYDRNRALVIDPSLLYSETFVGSTPITGPVNSFVLTGAAVDSAGNTYLAGYAQTFKGPSILNALGPSDGLVIKLNASGTVLYTAHIGGSKTNQVYGIALDGAGRAYLCGTTNSTDFPITTGALQATFGGGHTDGFVCELDSSGSSLVYSSYLGGTSNDSPNSIAVDSLGYAYVAGWTGSTNFPTTTGAFQTTKLGASAVPTGFVAKIAPQGKALAYSTYLGGSKADYVTGIALDSADQAIVTGYTMSTDFPATSGSLQPVFSGIQDAFVAKVGKIGSGVAFATFLGDSGITYGKAIAVDSADNIYVGAETNAAGLPLTTNALQGAFAGDKDGYLAEIDPTGASLIYGSYLGGSAADRIEALGIDPQGRIYVAGGTQSTDFPTTSDALQTRNHGLWDAFLSVYKPGFAALDYATLIGGTYEDVATGVGVDANGRIFLAGVTNSNDFPTTVTTAQQNLDYYAFVASFSPAP